MLAKCIFCGILTLDEEFICRSCRAEGKTKKDIK